MYIKKIKIQFVACTDTVIVANLVEFVVFAW